MKKEPFDIKFKDKIISGEAKVTFKNDMSARIICWDRKGVKNSAGENVPIVALVNTHYNGEILMESTIDGHVYSRENGSHQGLFVEYDPIGITKQARVVYSLLKTPCIEIYFKKYGYVENEEMSWYWNAVRFANVYARSHTNELHNDLKKDGHWDYDDDYDWE
jgi:hypothetical protein